MRFCVGENFTGGKKFADELTHRDFLGTLMGLGIKRETIGDILTDDNCGYVFCEKKGCTLCARQS